MITILLAFAFTFFFLGTFAFTPSNPPNTPWYGRFNLVSAGLALWVLTDLLGHWPK
jgi:hypothetical protein